MLPTLTSASLPFGQGVGDRRRGHGEGVGRFGARAHTRSRADRPASSGHLASAVPQARSILPAADPHVVQGPEDSDSRLARIARASREDLRERLAPQWRISQFQKQRPPLCRVPGVSSRAWRGIARLGLLSGEGGGDLE